MKLNVINETKFKKKDLDTHYDKHVSDNWYNYLTDTTDEVLEPMSKEEYDESGDELSKQPVYSSDVDSKYDVVGFYSSRGKVIKYKKSTHELVVYIADSESNANTVSYYKARSDKNHSRYRRLFDREYLRDITPEDDYYNW